MGFSAAPEAPPAPCAPEDAARCVLGDDPLAPPVVFLKPQLPFEFAVAGSASEEEAELADRTAAIATASGDGAGAARAAPAVEPGKGWMGARGAPSRTAVEAGASVPTTTTAPRAAQAPVAGQAQHASLLLAGIGLVLLLLPLLYRLLGREEVLELESRRRVYEVVSAVPGLTAGSVARRAGIHRTSALRHLEILVRGGLLVAQPLGKRRVYFRNGSGLTAAQRKAGLLLESEPVRRLVDAIRATQGVSLRGLARATGLSSSTVYWHVNRLEREGILSTRREPRRGIAFTVALPVPRGDAADSSGQPS